MNDMLLYILLIAVLIAAIWRLCYFLWNSEFLNNYWGLDSDDD